MKKEKRLEEEEERRAKKKKREEKKKLKLNEKRRKAEQRKEKRKEKEANSAAAAARMAGMYVCEVCGLHGLVDDEVNGRFWFGCDEELCQRWYHEECLTDCEKMYVRESLEKGGDKWFCKRCKPWLYEEE
jgi:ATP-dependent 26S proteasome regulatory subunit